MRLLGTRYTVLSLAQLGRNRARCSVKPAILSRKVPPCQDSQIKANTEYSVMRSWCVAQGYQDLGA